MASIGGCVVFVIFQSSLSPPLNENYDHLTGLAHFWNDINAQIPNKAKHSEIEVAYKVQLRS